MATKHSIKQLHSNLTSYSLGVGNGNPLQYSRLENPMDTGDYSSVVSVAPVGYSSWGRKSWAGLSY